MHSDQEQNNRDYPEINAAVDSTRTYGTGGAEGYNIHRSQYEL